MDVYGSSSSSVVLSAAHHHEAVSDQSCFRIDDLLDLSNVDVLDDNNHPGDHLSLIPDHQSSFISAQPHHLHCFASSHFYDFTNVVDLCVPSDDVAELEWLSRFVGGEDDLSSLYAGSIDQSGSSGSEISAAAAAAGGGGAGIFPNNNASPSVRARSKRSRGQTGTASWAPEIVESSPATIPAAVGKPSRPRRSSSEEDESPATSVRRCAHCMSEKTPQWRTGPMGPKTLCNACGVRFKSGRLVPEYRPAASPTFVLTQHSNSHRKVMELRRQKELSLLSRRHHHHQSHQHPPPQQRQEQFYPPHHHPHHQEFRVC